MKMVGGDGESKETVEKIADEEKLVGGWGKARWMKRKL